MLALEDITNIGITPVAIANLCSCSEIRDGVCDPFSMDDRRCRSVDHQRGPRETRHLRR